MSAVPFLTDDASYDEAINGDMPVLVDFTASWCGPCKQLAPVLDEMSVELRDRLNIVKVDIDTSKSLVERYAIKSVPTMMLFEQGELLVTMQGAKPKRELIATIEPLL